MAMNFLTFAPSRPPVLRVLLAVALTYALATTKPAAAQNSDGPLIDRALEQLMREAQSLDKSDNGSSTPVPHRPAGAVAQIPTSAAGAVLQRMAGKLTGDDFRDTYIRWQLMDVVNRADAATLAKNSNQLAALLQALPSAMKTGYKQEYRYEPPEIAARWWKLWHESKYLDGYPPFQREYHGRDALNNAKGAEKERLKPIVEEMERLRPQFKQIPDHDAIAFNRRLDQLNFLHRQYGGELVYALLRTGDPRLFEIAFNEAGRHASQRQLIAFDLLAYAYLAYLNGELNVYDAKTLSQAGSKLLQTATPLDGFKAYRVGDKEPWWGTRNYADYAYHLVRLLRLYDHFPPPARTAGLSSHVEHLRHLSADDPLTLERVNQSIAQGVHALYQLEPNYGIGQPPRYYHDDNQWEHILGHQALAMWSMFAADQPAGNIRNARRISWILGQDPAFTFDRAMRLQMLSLMPPDFWGPWVRRDVERLGMAFQEDGGFVGKIQDDRKDETAGDNTQAFYGLMGFWAAARVGIVADASAWKRMNDYWIKAQLPDGSWGRVSAAAKEGEKKADPVMTAAGVAALTVTQQYLAETVSGYRRSDEDLKARNAGLEWLDQHFQLNDPAVEEADWYYYMWIIQQVGFASGYRTFNGVDWNTEVTREILNRQLPDGTWGGEQGKTVSTAFAMLYLSQANAAVGAAKLQYAGAWNDEPDDLLNFARYASNRYESPIIWQVVDANLTGGELLESPMLYLSASDQFTFTPEQFAHLRNYVEGGGMFIINVERNNAGVQQSIANFASQVIGGDIQPQPIDQTHDFFRIHQSIDAKSRITLYANGIRPLIVVVTGGVGDRLASNDTDSDAFPLMSNIYLYLKGGLPRKGRLEHEPLPDKPYTPRQTLTVARVDVGPGSDPEPAALLDLAAAMRTRQQVKVDVKKLTPVQLDKSIDAAFLSVGATTKLTDPQASALRQWVSAGGWLWIDIVGGRTAGLDPLDAIIRQLSPERPAVPLPQNSPIVTGDAPGDDFDGKPASHGMYRRYALWSGYIPRGANLRMIEFDNRPAMIISRDDLTAGLAGFDHWGIFGYTPQAARQLVINGLLEIAATKNSEQNARE